VCLHVFYELAVRHTVRKPIVQMIRKNERIPFDVSGMRTVYYDIHDVRFIEQTKKELMGHIQNVEKTPENAESPISAVLNFEVLKSSDNPETRSIAGILSEIAEIKSLLLDVQTRVSPFGVRFSSGRPPVPPPDKLEGIP